MAATSLFEEAVEETSSDSDLLSTVKETDASALMTLEDAKQAISEETLKALAEQFNGKLSGVRPVDSKDLLF